MANNHFLASVYASRKGNSAPRALNNPLGIPATAGVQVSLPSAGCVISPLTAIQVFNGANTQTLIEVLPTGLNQPSTFYFSSETVSALSTKAV
jgi:hypothetical protein